MKYEILLADDDDSVRLVLHKALTRAGHSVKATDNADTLIKWAEAGQGDIIVTCLLYTSPSPRDKRQSRMPSSA